VDIHGLSKLPCILKDDTWHRLISWDAFNGMLLSRTMQIHANYEAAGLDTCVDSTLNPLLNSVNLLTRTNLPIFSLIPILGALNVGWESYKNVCVSVFVANFDIKGETLVLCAC